MPSLARLRNEVSTAIKYVPYRHQAIKIEIGTLTESLHTWLKRFRNLSTQAAILVFENRVTLMGQSKASHNLLQRKEINLWDWY